MELLIVFLDACAIIYWMEGGEPWFNRVTERLAELRKTYNDPPMAVAH